jgi:hypothetical protein
MSKQHHFIAGEYFSKRTRNALARRGVYVIGVQMIPGEHGMLDAYPAYCLDDNDTGIVRSRAEVEAIAARPLPSKTP